MSRLASLDRALVLILVPLWAVCFGLSVSAALHRAPMPPVYVSTAKHADDYPILTRFRGGAESQLKVGDRLLRLGNADLRGVNAAGFLVRFAREVGSDRRVIVVFERAGERRETSLPVVSYADFWPRLLVSFVFGFAALFLFLRARPSQMMRAFAQTFLCVAFSFAYGFGESELDSYLSLAVGVVSLTLLGPLALRLALLLPHGVPPMGRWARVWPWFFAAIGPLQVGRYYGFPFSPQVGRQSVFTALAGLLATLLIVVTHKYRGADPIARRQIKWAIFGFYCALAPPIVGIALYSLDPRFLPTYTTSLSALALGPLFLLVAVARYNLFDIDRLLSATASYNIVAVVLGAGALVVVPRLAEAVSGVAGVDPGTGQIVLSLALAAVLIPAHRRLRPQIDRVFFKERFALDHGIAELLPTLSACTNTRELTERAGAGLHRLLRPEACVVYAGVEQSYAPVFVEGRAVPPAFAAGSSLIVALQERRAPLSLSEAGRRPDEAPLGPFDRAALETLQAEVVVPVRQDDALSAFVCLGPKRSGDVYTSTDLSLMAAVAETVSHQLQHFDQAEVIREGREMQESLRRYVPGAVAEQLSSGTELTSGEREVTVLFVDIRGYTSFSESRQAAEIFSTVNRYTETVSRIVQQRAGSVVEFNGDGMMAVFGAPRELAHKERAAVEAGREIVEAVAALPVEDSADGSTKLSVGVGIATGVAFVGNIQAVDRMIWTAIGNTTNLASRLQSLTRELDAAIVIDRTTWQFAGATAAEFELQESVPIRGRRETQDLYLLS